MVWFKASHTPSSVDIHQNSCHISHCFLSHRGSMVIVPQDQSLHKFQQVIDGVDVRVGQPKFQDMGLGGIWARWSWTLGLLPRWGVEPTLLGPCHLCLLSYTCGEGGTISSECGEPFSRGVGQGQLSCYSVQKGVGPAIPGPVRIWPAQHDPWVSIHMTPMTLCGNMSHGHHYRPQLQWEHGPRHDPWRQLRSRIHHGPGGSTGYPGQYGLSSTKAPSCVSVSMN